MPSLLFQPTSVCKQRKCRTSVRLLFGASNPLTSTVPSREISRWWRAKFCIENCLIHPMKFGLTRHSHYSRFVFNGALQQKTLREHWPWIRRNKSPINYVIKFAYTTAVVYACERRKICAQRTTGKKIPFFQLPLIYFDIKPQHWTFKWDYFYWTEEAYFARDRQDKTIALVATRLARWSFVTQL